MNEFVRLWDGIPRFGGHPPHSGRTEIADGRLRIRWFGTQKEHVEWLATLPEKAVQ